MDIAAPSNSIVSNFKYISAEVFKTLKDVAKKWQEDKVSRLAAALAYYAVFAIAPLLLITISMAGLIFGEQAARGEIVTQTETIIGTQAAEAIQWLLQTIDKPSSGIIATLIGFGTLLISASGFFAQLQDALNTIWHYDESSQHTGLGQFFRQRLAAFFMVLLLGILFIGLLFLSTLIGSMQNLAEEQFMALTMASRLLDIPVTFLFLVLMTSFLFRFVPTVTVAWRDIFIGALVTGLLLTLGKYAIQLYLQNSAVVSTYGLAGSVIVIMLWVYFSAHLFFLGAEFTRVYAERYGSLKQQHADNADE